MQTDFSIPSRIEAISPAVDRITSFARDAGIDDSSLFGIEMAARESIANAVKHGNKLDENKRVEIELSSDDTGLAIRVRDRGEGFRVEDVPDPTDSENVLKTSGRGLLFIRNFTDEAIWSEHPGGGTVVLLRKRR